MRILCVGMSHKTAPVDIREQLAFSAAGRDRALRQLADQYEQAEFAILSTCNRAEVYTARPVHGHPREEQIHRFLGQFFHLPVERFAGSTYTLADRDAAEHLFAVACGLDSLVPGEVQITAQVKDALRAAARAGTAGPVLHELMQRALRTAKHIRRETDIGAGKVSVASVAVDCIAEAFGAPSGKCVLSIGAGKMNQLLLTYMRDAQVGRILIANRSARKAAALARKYGGETVAMGELARRLDEPDIIVTSTAAEAPILTAEMLSAALTRRDGKELFIVDLAVPRDVEPAAGKLSGVRLINIDQLDRIVAGNLRLRGQQLEPARRIIDGHVDEFFRRLNVRQVAPTIDALYRRMERICREELASAENKLAAHDTAAADLSVLRQAVRRALRKFVHPCVENLHRSAGSDAVRAHVAALQRLFELDQEDT